MSRRGRGGSPFSLFSFQDIITCVSGIIILITLVLALELSQRKPGKPQVQTENLVARLQTAIVEALAEVARLEASLRGKSDRALEVSTASIGSLNLDLFAVNEQIKSLKSEIASLEAQAKDLAKKEQNLQAKHFDRQKDREQIARREQKAKELEDKVRDIREQDRLFYNSRTPDGKQVWLVQISGARTLVAQVGVTSPPKALTTKGSLFGSSPFEYFLESRSPGADFFFLLVRPDGTEAFADIKKALTASDFSYGFDVLGPEQNAVDPEKGAATP